jgi:hypothetical protein
VTREYDKMASAAIEETSELRAKLDELKQEVQLYQNRQLWDENKALDEMRVAAQRKTLLKAKKRKDSMVAKQKGH